MKINLKESKETISNIDFKHKVNFNIGNKVSKLIWLLRDGFYSNKIQTMIQEYLSNARDSHRASNSDKKIQVILPTVKSPSLVIKDFGLGMDLEGLNLFCSYLYSTKDEDDSQTGGYGIGGKIAFAYTDSFVIVSRKEGNKYSVIANKVENSDGVMNIVGPEKTNEPNGVDVIIPILEKDFEEVERSVIRLQLFWNSQIEIVNDDFLNLKHKKINDFRMFNKDCYSFYLFDREDDFKNSKMFKTYTCGSSEKNYPFFITIDDIPYNLSEKIYSQINRHCSFPLFLSPLCAFEETRGYIHSHLILKFKTNELNIVGTRESISDKDSNIEKIGQRLKEVSELFKKDFFNKIEKELNPKKAIDLIIDLRKSMTETDNDFLISSFHNQEKIEISNNSFFLEEKVPTYILSTRRSYSEETVEGLLLYKSTSYSFRNTDFESLYYFKREKEPSLNSLRSLLRKQHNIYISRSSTYFQKIENSHYEKLKQMGFSPNFIEFNDKQLKSRIVDDNNILVSRVLISDQDGLGTTIEKSKTEQVSLNDLRKGLCITNKEFSKIIISKADKLVLKMNKLEIYIVGEKTLEKLKGKITTLSDLYQLEPNKLTLEIKKTPFKLENFVTNLNYDEKNIFLIFYSKILNKKEFLEWKNFNFNQKFDRYDNQTKINLFYGFYRNEFKKEISVFEKKISDFQKKNSIVNYLDHNEILKLLPQQRENILNNIVLK